jgi:diguanylate cyclase (GGDEF)-like protein
MKLFRTLFSSLKWQLFVGVIALHALLMGIFIYDIVHRERQFIHKEMLAKSDGLSRLIASNSALGILNNDLVALAELVNQIKALSDVDTVFIMDHNFIIRASNDSTYLNRMAMDSWSQKIQKELISTQKEGIQKEHDGVIDTCVPIRIEKRTVGYVRMISSTDTIDLQIASLRNQGLLYLFLAITSGALIAWLIVRHLTGRLTLLSKAASQVARQNYDIDLPPFSGNDELSQMGRAFSLMIDSIHKQVSELEAMLFQVKAAEMLERKRYEQSERYQSALFQWSKIEYDNPEIAIRNAMEISAHTLKIERVSVWLINTQNTALLCHDLYTVSSGDHDSGMFLYRTDYPHYFELIDNGDIIAVDDAQNDPQTAEFTEGYLKPLMIFSMLDMPITVDGKVIGVICHEHIGSIHNWSPEEKEFAITISNALALTFEIDKRKKVEQTLAYKAHHDELTHLSNRTLFLDRLEHSINKAKRQKKMLAVLFIDLDRFKEINDSLGHAMGDAVLIEVADRLRENLRDIDTIARLGGDEFTLIVEDVDDIQKVNTIALKLLSTLQEAMHIQEHQLYVTISIGISLYPLDGDDPQSLLRNADSAMYKAKEEGRNSYQYYTTELTQRAFERVSLETSLRRAIANREFVVYYQAQTNGATDQMIGMEALVRWEHPDMGLISPAHFIPLAEETGLILAIDALVMEESMKQISQWYREGLNPGVLSLNLAMKQLWQENFAETLQRMLEKSGCLAEWIELEVTESEVMKNPEKAIGILKQLHDLGIILAIDDFGTGYSSLSYLKRLPVDILKIDQSFIRGLPDNNEDIAIVRSIIALAKSMGLHVIAEGVETLEQKEFLVENGCLNIQGYFYARPISATDMDNFLRQPLVN